jgi:NAD(P)-dependent dehydrogenase (short-subunit alcohol dehydrogenase family)
MIAVNQTSVFLGTKLAAEQMAKTSGRSIVNISSIKGFVGSTSGHPAYHASKGAVRIYSKAAAVRYGPSGVRVNTVHPAYMPPDAFFFDYDLFDRFGGIANVRDCCWKAALRGSTASGNNHRSQSLPRTPAPHHRLGGRP